MLNGFVGGAAKQWLSRAEAVLNAAIGVHNRNAHGVSITNERELPYTPDQALSGGGGGGSENIVADRDIYWQAMQYATDANLANGESIYQALMYVQQICSTDFLLPATTPVVQETAAQLMTALNNINNLRHEYVGIVRSIPGALAEDPTGHQVDMAWNASAANGIWREIEQTLNAQAPHMQDTITAHNREIGRMINALSQLAATANTASCPDTRAAAQRQMNEYQRRISTLQTAIMNLQRGIDDLQTGTSTLRRQLGTTQETLQETDRQLAERIRSNNELMNVAIRRVQNIMEGIETNFPNLAVGLLRGNRLDRQQFMFPDGALFGHDEHGNLVFNWEEIAKILDKPYYDISAEQYIKLIEILFIINNHGSTQDLAQFIQYMPYKVGTFDIMNRPASAPDFINTLFANSNDFDILIRSGLFEGSFSQFHHNLTMWAMCPNKLLILSGGMYYLAHANAEKRSVAMQLYTLFSDLNYFTFPTHVLNNDFFSSNHNLFITNGDRPNIIINETSRYNIPMLEIIAFYVHMIEYWNMTPEQKIRLGIDEPQQFLYLGERKWEISSWTTNTNNMGMLITGQQVVFNNRAFAPSQASLTGSGLSKIAEAAVKAALGITTGMSVVVGSILSYVKQHEQQQIIAQNHTIAQSLTAAQYALIMSDTFPVDMIFNINANGHTVINIFGVFNCDERGCLQVAVDAVNASGVINSIPNDRGSLNFGDFNPAGIKIVNGINQGTGQLTVEHVINFPMEVNYWFMTLSRYYQIEIENLINQSISGR